MQTLKDRIAVVTGAGSGIGEALVYRLGREGAHLVCLDVRAEAARRVATKAAALGVRALPIACDVSDLDAVTSAVEHVYGTFGPVSLLVANAGVGVPGGVVGVSDRNRDWAVAVNIDGTINSIRAFLPRMRKQAGERHVVVTASMLGLTRPGVDDGMYAVTKYALVGLGEALRTELAPDRIRVSLLCPGLTDTHIWQAVRARPGRYGGPREVPQELGARWSRGLSTETVAEQAVKGILADRFYILAPADPSTDRGKLQARHDEIMSAFEEGEKR